MPRTISFVLAAALTFAGTSCLVSATPGDGYIVYESPPPPRARVSLLAPFPGAVWISGYWTWTGNGWVWVDGRWEAARTGHIWIQSGWQRRGTGWGFVEGRWTPSARVRVRPPRGRVEVRAAPAQRPRPVEVRPARPGVEVRPPR